HGYDPTKVPKNPDVINASRWKRIAAGAGTTEQRVNILLKQYKQINEMMKKASKMNPKNLLHSGIEKLFS
ncbi:MAG: signal recognition particle protein, partial [Rickettsia endosymbiont of Ixodes ricinus]|nr:signal recognition particle protein [Rickettsia endosymbiont of Ixodes ricinus]